MNTIAKAQVAVGEARKTLASSTTVLGLLTANLSESPRHAVELTSYLKAFAGKLDDWCTKVEQQLAGGQAPAVTVVQLLTTRRFEFESALRFIKLGFINPRQSEDKQALEVADWLCVEGFQLFVAADRRKTKVAGNFPLGPMVALDSRRSPAVWDEDAELTIPSLFDLTARVHRSSGDSTSGLAVFPIVTLPADLARLPEYYPLLAHEVGHAADAAFGYSIKIIERLQAEPMAPHLSFWKSWMREIVADAAGVALSGEAFALAWLRFTASMSPKTDLSDSDPYPPNSLRLEFLRQMLQGRRRLNPALEPKLLDDEEPLDHDLYEVLKSEFGNRVLPLLSELVLSAVAAAGPKEKFVRDAAQLALNSTTILWERQQFMRLPSVLTQATVRAPESPKFDAWAALPRWLASFRQANKAPRCMSEKASTWKFDQEFLPTLRPTILGPDGLTKIPPRVLLLTHRKIAFLGATQKWLLAALTETLEIGRKEKSGAPFWEEIEIYFASDKLLPDVEYYDSRSRRVGLKEVQRDRAEALKELQDFFRRNAGCCGRIRFYYFDGPPVFGSFWDWDEPGGRIHISSQLAGIDLSKCPSVDYLWLHDWPTRTYDQYRDYLSSVRKRAKRIPLDGPRGRAKS